MSGWTPERRAKQAVAIRHWAPWRYSTGPRTVEGKAESARNAYQGSQRTWWRAVDVVFAMYRRNPGAKTVAECEPLTPREIAALEVYDRLNLARIPIEQKIRYMGKRAR